MTHLIYMQIWRITRIHITLILSILICAHLGAGGHLLKEQLGLIWIYIVHDDFCYTLWMPGSTDNPTVSQRAKKLREKQIPEAYCPTDNTLPLGHQESAPGAVSSEWHCPGSL